MQHYSYKIVRSACGVLLALTLAACGAADTAQTASVAAQPMASMEQTQAAMLAPTATAPAPATPTISPTNTAIPTPAATTTVDPTATMLMPNQGAGGMATASAAASATIKLFMFQPDPIEVKVGTAVTWTNADNIEHSVTSGASPAPDTTFDSGFFTQGQTFSFTFTQPGEFTYFCKRHPSMQGVLKVTS